MYDIIHGYACVRVVPLVFFQLLYITIYYICNLIYIKYEYFI
jgi:hypothetical protein